ncbi:hypothetical protein LTR33_014361 [Friedmanniomyces endolithicus]|nr:hypothetical protein LTR33_014361 [Friedmanniomyces endolithicus]
MIGHAPELSSATSRRRTLKEPKASVGPLYAFRHPALTTGSFYVKLALRKAQGDKSELLAVGSGSGSPVLIPTDEQYFPAREATTEMLEENDEDEGDDDLPLPLPASRTDVTEFPRPIHSLGTALIRGHNKEVTSLCFSHQGARCWRQDGVKAREMRGCGEGGGRRWGYGWAEMDAAWDEEDG